MAADEAQIAADEDRARLNALSRAIIGKAQQVSTRLGHGFLERVYENALVYELTRDGFRIDQQKAFAIRYEEAILGTYVKDLIVDGDVLVEVKAVNRLLTAHRDQCVHYLRTTGLRLGLLLNFGTPRLEVRRVVWRY